MAATWQQIYEGETDANSPLGQTLMDKIRENLDYLKEQNDAGLGLLTVNASIGNNLSPYVYTLDSGDWRDRMIFVTGLVVHDTQADCNTLIPGGSNDNVIGSSLTPTPPAAGGEYGFFNNAWMYTSDGSSAFSTAPYIYLTFTGSTTTTVYIWVDDTDGYKLKMRLTNTGGVIYYAINLAILFTPDLGGY